MENAEPIPRTRLPGAPIPSVPDVDDSVVPLEPAPIGPDTVWQPPALYAREPRRHPWEIPVLVIAVLASVAAYGLVITLVALGMISQFLLIPLVLPLLVFLGRGLGYASMRANAVQVTPTQFPDAFAIVVEAAARYGMEYVPDAYVMNGNGQVNAFASGHGFRRYIVVYSDLFEVGGRARSPEALKFVIGHEVGHIAAGHTSYWRQLFSSLIMSVPILGSLLSRAQEYTADNYGYYSRPDGAAPMIGLLSSGKYLLSAIDFDQFADRAVHERGFFITLVNALSAHPVLTWRAAALRDRTRSGAILFRPRAFVRGTGSGHVTAVPAPHAPAQVAAGSLPNGLSETGTY
ncbi:M48 family metallopeptidase [Gordonia sp. HY002]|uniref:M48 family metallopeptidase n=1 Tax=Gordonia zhenghanii TaxID=2911516 RepID=UPI001EF10E56|nr:M48 family metallopeptidase [Gordonia zhenghanii]MCF8569481.1 M48 family metallopeptidase [Gordonia zhenghanii]MCF8602348.1 M48 family metallopeptidase [Gordonia zhenghanii]